MNKKVINLTEQDIHSLVEDAVMIYLTENEMEEINWGGLSALGSKFTNSASRMGRNMSNSAGKAVSNLGNRLGKAANSVGQKVGQTKDAMGQAYNNAKTTYQVGSINNEAQKAVNNAKAALEKLQQLNQQLINMGQSTVLDKNTAPMVQNLLDNLSRIGGGFQGRRTMYTR